MSQKSFSLLFKQCTLHPIKILHNSMAVARSSRVDAPIYPLYTQPSTPGGN
jgi:hypothetical protein